MDTKEETVLFRSDKNSIYAIAINSTGSRIAFVDKNGSLRILDTRTKQRYQQSLPLIPSVFMDVKFSPDDRQIATSSMDKTVKIWDANNLSNRPIVINKHEYMGTYQLPLVPMANTWYLREKMETFITGLPMLPTWQNKCAARLTVI